MAEHDWKDWSRWLQEGFFISYIRDNARYYEHIVSRDLAHWEYDWPEAIAPLQTSGPDVPDDLEITRGYDPSSNSNNIWQLIFGIQSQAYIYIELPTDTHRHGIPKIPKPSSSMRRVSHFEEWMSPFKEPTFLTEHFLMRPGLDRMGFDAYNPQDVTIPSGADNGLKLNIFIAKMVTERIGTESQGVLTPANARWKETLDKLWRRVIPHKPITLMPVRLPAEAPAGE